MCEWVAASLISHIRSFDLVINIINLPSVYNKVEGVDGPEVVGAAPPGGGPGHPGTGQVQEN